MRSIVIDPGHGGHEARGKATPHGARGPSGTLEKDVVLQLSHRVAHHLGGRAALTRADDHALSLSERIAVVQQQGGEVFVSIHTSYGGSGGPAAWVHAGASPASEALARSIDLELGGSGGVRRAELAVLAPDRLSGHTAACLVEVDAIDAPEGEARLLDPWYLDRLGSAIARGVEGFLGTPKRPPQTGTTATVRPWTDFFKHTAGTSFIADGPFSYNGTGEVITNSGNHLVFTLSLPAYSILGREIPALAIRIDVTYIGEGAGNQATITVNGQQVTDNNVTITTTGGRRRAVPSVRVPGANLEWIEVENESGREVDLDLRVDGQSVDFDLEAR